MRLSETVLAVSLVCTSVTVLHGQASRPAPGAAETGQAAEAESLVAKLGDDDYAAREYAARRLFQIGYPAMDVLGKASKSSDREIRQRARRIAMLIRDVDFQRRLAAFEAERDETASHGLPGWDLYRKLCGHDYAARALFIEMQKDEPDLMRWVEMPVDSGREQLTKYLSQRQMSFDGFADSEWPVGSVAAVVFAASQLKLYELPEAGDDVYRACRHESIVHAITNGTKRDVLRKVCGQWVSQAYPTVFTQALMLSFDFQLPEGLKIAERSLANRENNPFERHYAMAVVGRFGNTSHIPLLEALLNDHSALAGFQQTKDRQLQVRDAALLTILHLSHMSPAEFGFREGQVDSPVAQAWYFESDEKRNQAIKRWRSRAAKTE